MADPQESADNHELAWAEACRRDDVIRELLQKHTMQDGKIGRQAVARAAASLGLSTPTLYRLISKFRAQRTVAALLPGKSGRPVGHRRLSPAVEEIIERRIKDVYLKPERRNFARLCREIRADAHAAGETLPAVITIRRRLEQVDPLKLARLRHDEAAVEAKVATPGRLATERPLDFVQIDHTPVDVFVVDDETREVVTRPWLTLAIDVHTRMVAGFSLSFDPPQTTSVSLCLLHSVFDKTAWLQSLGIDIAWPVAGLPKTIGVDNAKEFRSPKFERAARNFGIKIEFRPLGKKHYGGHIERLIGTKMGAVQLLPGTTHGSVPDKQNYDPQASAVMTFRELETWLALEIAGQYHQRIHSALKRPPIAVWRDWEDRVDLELPVDRMAFWVSFLPEENADAEAGTESTCSVSGIGPTRCALTSAGQRGL